MFWVHFFQSVFFARVFDFISTRNVFFLPSHITLRFSSRWRRARPSYASNLLFYGIFVSALPRSVRYGHRTSSDPNRRSEIFPLHLPPPSTSLRHRRHRCRPLIVSSWRDTHLKITLLFIVIFFFKFFSAPDYTETHAISPTRRDGSFGNSHGPHTACPLLPWATFDQWK